VEGHLSKGLAPLRNLVLGRFPTFFQKLMWSPAKEVTIMAEVATDDARTVTASNLAHVSALTKLDCASDSCMAIKRSLPVEEVPVHEEWWLGLLDTLLRQREELEKDGKDRRRIVAMISSQCST
jgi:hypothetical protein